MNQPWIYMCFPSRSPLPPPSPSHPSGSSQCTSPEHLSQASDISLENEWIYFWPCCTACWILIPWPGIEPVLPAVGCGVLTTHLTGSYLYKYLTGSHFWNCTNSLLLIKLSPFFFWSIQFLPESVLGWLFSESIVYYQPSTRAFPSPHLCIYAYQYEFKDYFLFIEVFWCQSSFKLAPVSSTCTHQFLGIHFLV